MIDLQALKTENKRWHEEHALWVEETLYWQRKTQRLVALLYKLERALPQHSLALTQHVALIKEHERLVSQYESGLNEECYPTCPGFDSETEIEAFHQHLCQLHGETEQSHTELSKKYLEEMGAFKALAQKLVD
jgi:Fe-S-cluster containining protein